MALSLAWGPSMTLSLLWGPCMALSPPQGQLWLYHWHGGHLWIFHTRGPKFLSAALPVSSHLLIVTMRYGKYICSLTKVLKKMRERI